MNALRPTDRTLPEWLDARPVVEVSDVEYRRLLGYPRGHEPTAHACELAEAARCWFAEHARPWIYLREVEMRKDGEEFSFDGVAFDSPRLRQHLEQAGAERALVMAVSAGVACEARAAMLWDEEKPDEYFFLEMYGSAVVEQLAATASGRICEHAGQDGWRAVAPYSPGYTGWDIADQPQLFQVIRRGVRQAWPEPLEVLASGMPRPKKSLLAIVGLTRRPVGEGESARLVPCESCALTPCRYRRRAYRHTVTAQA